VTQVLPFCRYIFTVRVLEPLRLPSFAGSLLRGSFGRSLRQLSCMTHMENCQDCPLLTNCPYTQIFEIPPPECHSLQKFSAVPNPYSIEPPQGGTRVLDTGDEFCFSMVLIGQALSHLPLIILAWERALAQGLNKSRSRCQLVSVHCEGDKEAIYLAGGKVRPHQPVASPLPTMEDTAVLEFTTPLRLQRHGRNVGLRELDARTLLIALARRYQLLCDTQMRLPPQLDFAALDEAAQHIDLKAEMRWRDWQRYSGRQKQAMPLGGLIGRINLSGNLAPFISLLSAGQWLHVGKETVFGLGHYLLHLSGNTEGSP